MGLKRGFIRRLFKSRTKWRRRRTSNPQPRKGPKGLKQYRKQWDDYLGQVLRAQEHPGLKSRQRDCRNSGSPGVGSNHRPDG